MIFPTLSISLLALVSHVAAAPHPHSRFDNSLARREVGLLAERGLTWTSSRRAAGNNNKNNNNNVALDITISELSVDIQNQGKRGNDLVLVQQLQERIIVVDNSRQFRDNVRRNTFKNKNNNVNTVLIIVTEVIDQRDLNNQNTRYLTRQIESNKDQAEKVFVVISESNQFTVGPQNIGGATGVTEAVASPTGDAQQYAVFDPTAEAAFQSDNFQELLPSGVGAPQWSNAKESLDPAEILLESPQNDVFVSFVNEDYANQQDAILVTIQV